MRAYFRLPINVCVLLYIGMRLIRTWQSAVLFAIATVLWASSSAVLLAEGLPCNTIIGLEETIEISDCINPFGVEGGAPFELLVDGIKVMENDTVFIATLGTSDYHALSRNFTYGFIDRFYRHEGDNYRQVPSNYLPISEPEYQTYALAYFGEINALVDLYIEYLLGNVVDTDIPGWYFAELDAFEAYVNSAHVYHRPILLPGTYSLVVEEIIISVSKAETEDWLDTIHNFFIKTAEAQSAYNPLTRKYALTFTLAEETQLPVGASSVLFLPGIMGSRLFEESDKCSIFGGIDIRERWFSSDGCDIERLFMDESGDSINNIFTELEGGIIEDVGLVINLYDSLLEDFDDWKEEEKIAEYRAIPYDWRLRLQDVLKTKNSDGKIIFDTAGTYQDGYIYKSLVDLKQASPAGKVVLVGHSNGGLVIQTLLASMKANNDPLLQAVEKVILVAVPQAGAPETILGLLHGVEVGKGLVISKEESRQLMNTAPFAYHLLPNADYYDMVETPVVRFDLGSSTDAWREQFGAELNTLEAVTNFLKKESNRTTPDWDDVLSPATTYLPLHDYAQAAHGYVEDWNSENLIIYEVAGVGVPTPATLTYFTDTECVKTEPYTNGSVVCVEFGPKLSYRVSEVVDGDGTVPAPSALAGAGTEKWWVNLKLYGKANLDRIHKDILEVSDVRKLISGVVSSSTLGQYDFLSMTKPDFSSENRLVYQLHSPLDMSVVLNDGEVVSSFNPQLRGVKYRRFGEVQHLSIPSEETGYKVHLTGLGAGSFTLDIEQYEGDSLKERVSYSALPSSTSTEVVIEGVPVGELSEIVLQLDYEGNGVFEILARPGLAEVRFITTTGSATTTPPVITKKSNRNGTKVKNRGLTIAPKSNLRAATVYTDQREVKLEFIKILIQYRDLLIKLRVK